MEEIRERWIKETLGLVKPITEVLLDEMIPNEKPSDHWIKRIRERNQKKKSTVG
jgi:hypothetical protein